jgi:hypothetical protein
MKQYILKILIAAVAILILYYIMSPFQNCLRNHRDVGLQEFVCYRNSSW